VRRANRRKSFVADLPARGCVLRCGRPYHDFRLCFPRHNPNLMGLRTKYTSRITSPSNMERTAYLQVTATDLRTGQKTQEGMIERRLREAHKAKGRFLLRDLALSVPIFGDPVLVPDHSACHPEIAQHPRATARVHFALLMITLAARAFPLPSVSSFLDRVSLPLSKTAVSPLSPSGRSLFR